MKNITMVAHVNICVDSTNLHHDVGVEAVLLASRGNRLD